MPELSTDSQIKKMMQKADKAELLHSKTKAINRFQLSL